MSACCSSCEVGGTCGDEVIMGQEQEGYPISWRIYFEEFPDFAEIFDDPEQLTWYLNTVPPDIAFKIVDQDGNVVYRFDGRPLPIMESYRSGWKETQATPHGRKTLYQRVQEQLLPSAARRRDPYGQYK